ncbi:MAG: flippase-like domain-containing protein [Kofleriaceae bacterium]
MRGRSAIIRAGFLLGGAVAFALALASADLDDALPIVAGIGPLVIVAILPFAAQIALDALAWRGLLVAAGQRVTWQRLFAVRFATEAVLMTVPGGSLVGESLKPILLARTAGVPASATVATIGVKRCLLGIAQAAYLAIAIVLGYSVLVAASPNVVGSNALPWIATVVAVGLAVVCGAVLVMFGHVQLVARIHGVMVRMPSRRVREAVERWRAGFEATDASSSALVRDRKALVVAWTLLLVAWIAETAETYVLLRLVGVDLDPLAVLAIEATMVFARNAAFFVPAGLGVQDAGYLAFLGAVGVASPAATAFVVVKRAKELVWVCIGYAVLFLLDSRRVPRATTHVSLVPVEVKTP